MPAPSSSACARRRSADSAATRSTTGSSERARRAQELVAVEHRLPQEVRRGSWRAALLQRQPLVTLAQSTGQGPHVGRVQPRHRGDQQALRGHRVEVVRMGRVIVVEVHHRAQRVQQRTHRGLAHQRRLVARHLDGNTGARKSATKQGDGGAPRPHQHGHLRPRDIVLEMGPAQQVGHSLDLGPLGVIGEDLDPVAATDRHGFRTGERRPRPGVDAAGQRDPRGHPLAGQQHSRTEPAYSRQGPHVARPAVAFAELVGEVEDSSHLGTTECVDRLVRVTHHREVGAIAGQSLEQSHLAGVGVLVLVDEHVLRTAPRSSAW